MSNTAQAATDGRGEHASIDTGGGGRVAAMEYGAFLRNKSQLTGEGGLKAVWMPDFLYDFQSDLVDWALWTGRSAILADCGLGKTPMELVWAENVCRFTGGNVLICSPLAVSHQIVREAAKFGIKATRSDDGTAYLGITVTNYERLHLFKASDFVGFVGDESSILKSFDGTRRREITVFMRQMRFRLLSTATPAPNDFTELGTTSEALGHLGHVDMLSRFFTNSKRNIAQGRNHGKQEKWRFKGHAETPYWRWVCSWARAIRRPSDLGFSDDRYTLPELIPQIHMVHSDKTPDGCLFAMPAVTLEEERAEIRRTIEERCQHVADLVNNSDDFAFVGCHLNEEGDLLAKLIPDAVQVSGSDSDAVKEGRLLDFAEKRARVLVTKDRIAGWGLNLQHCNQVYRFPSHSYEAYYQWVRRCWRFGQTRPVTSHIVTTEGCRRMLDNMLTKAGEADKMFARLVEEMNNPSHIECGADFTKMEIVPSWLS